MFQYYQPTRIHFGENSLDKLGEIAACHGRACLLVTTPDAPLQPLYERVKGILSEKGIQVVHFDGVKPNPDVEMVEEGFEMIRERKADFVLAVGGGSSIDTAKVIAFCNGQEKIDWDYLFGHFSSPYENYPPYSDTALPLLAVPTTSGTGSQVTQAAVITRGKEKLTFYHPMLFSRECIVDPVLMRTLPPRITAATGFDAFTHAFESFCNSHASYYSEMDSLQAMKLIIENLPRVMEEPDCLEYRKNMALADTLAGRALANSGAGAPHPLSEIIGGLARLPHGEALSVVFLPYVKKMTELNRDKFLTVARLFNPGAQKAEELYGSVQAFLAGLGLNKKLADYKVSRADFEEMLRSPVLDVLPFGSRHDLEEILGDAYE